MGTAAADGFDQSAAAGEHGRDQGNDVIYQQQGTLPGEQQLLEQTMGTSGAAAGSSDAQQQLGLGTALDSLAAVAAAAGHHFYEEQQRQQAADYSTGEEPGRKQKRMRNLNEDFDQAAGRSSLHADDDAFAAAAAAAAASASVRKPGGSGSRQQSGSGSAIPGGTSQWKRPRHNSSEMDPQQRHFEQAKQYQQRQHMLAAGHVAAAQGDGGQDGSGDAQQLLVDDASAGGEPNSLQQALHHRLQQLLLPELGKQAILQSLDSATQCMVECGSATGIFSVDSERILCLCSACSTGKGPTGPEFMPSEFERHGGMAACKKWRFSIKVADGGPGMTLGRWLDMRGIQISSYPTKFRNPVSRQKRPLELGKGLLSGGTGGPTIQLDVSQLLAGLVAGNSQLTGALKSVLGGPANSSGTAAAGGTFASGLHSSSGVAASGPVGPADVASLLGAAAGGGANSTAKLSELAAAVADLLVKEIPAAAAAAVVPLAPALGGPADEPSGGAIVSSGMPASTTAMSAWPDVSMLGGPSPVNSGMDVPVGYAIAAQVASGMPLDLAMRQEQQQQLQQRNTLSSGLVSGTNMGLLDKTSAQSVTHPVRQVSSSPGGHDPLCLQAGHSMQHSSSSAMMQMLQRYQQQHGSMRPPASQHPDNQQQQLRGNTLLPPTSGAGDDLPPLPPGVSGQGSLQMRRSSSLIDDVGSAGQAVAWAVRSGLDHSSSGHAGSLGPPGPLLDHTMQGQLPGTGTQQQQHASAMHNQQQQMGLIAGDFGAVQQTFNSGGSGGRAAAAAGELAGPTSGRWSDSGGYAARRGSLATEPVAAGHRSGHEPLGSDDRGYRSGPDSQPGTELPHDVAGAAKVWGGQMPAAAAEPTVDWQKLVGSLENRLDVLLEDRRRKKQLEEQLAAQSAMLSQLQAELADERRRRLAVEQKLAALSSLLLDKLEAAGDDRAGLPTVSAAGLAAHTAAAAAYMTNGTLAQQPLATQDEGILHGSGRTTRPADGLGLGATSAAAAAIAAANAAAAVAAVATDPVSTSRLEDVVGDVDKCAQAAGDEQSAPAGSAGVTATAAATKQDVERVCAAPKEKLQQQQADVPAPDEALALAGRTASDGKPAENQA